ncbi:MAG: hypothetical protein KAI66_16910, partial [Lentisphaeria bacterium]|nr:hypothetical protein [Lentisphaeria bacterium]
MLVLALSGCDSDVGGPNRAPVAVAGPDAEAGLLDDVALDGSGSYDPDGDALSYTWQVLSRPENSTADPVDAGGMKTSLHVDVGGVYIVALVVFDGQAYSERDVMQIRAAGCESNAECEDDLYCTVNERCEEGLCLSDTRDCEPAGDDCNAGVCDEASTSCVREALPNDTLCTDDDLFCTGDEICRSGDCVSAGNPCEPADSCDENTDACGGCGDGEVLGSEECDPGTPQNDNCCDAATCKWVVDGEADPQDECSGAAECQLDVCGGGGECTLANAEDGTDCGDSTPSLCDGADTCHAGHCETNLAGADTLCRDEAADCDVAEYCDGVNPDCPQDQVKEASASCRQPGGVCDAEEFCDGVNKSCPADLRLVAGTECRQSTDADCDPVENCDGVQVDCPVDAVLPNDTPCTDDGLFCTGPETCQLGVCTNGGNPCPTPGDCDDVNNICGACGDGVVGPDEDCDPGALQGDNCCNVGDCSWTSSGLVDPQGVCSGAGECRVDVCDGSGTGGCTEAFAGDGADCGSNDDTLCDNPDSCLNGACQENLEASDTLCRSSTGPCDPEENCDGSSADCPSDQLDDGSLECRPSQGDCDPAEFCDGSSAGCPGDTRAEFGDACRPSAGDCDLAENCNGVNAGCPDDVMAGNNVECRPVDGVCDLAENCAGGVDCPDDVMAGNNVECRPADGVCDLAENCAGGVDCPSDVFADGSLECRISTGDCDPAENCAGGVDCPTDLFASEGVSCEAGDTCLTGDACGDGDGICHEGATQKDDDLDGHVDDACDGNDCDDGDPDIYTGAEAEGSGNICDAAGSCFDGVDNDCDGDTDSEDTDCQVSDYMCLYGPGSNLTTGGAGGTLTVRLDSDGYNPDDIVCYTDTNRLLTPEVL